MAIRRGASNSTGSCPRFARQEPTTGLSASRFLGIAVSLASFIINSRSHPTVKILPVRPLSDLAEGIWVRHFYYDGVRTEPFQGSSVHCELSGAGHWLRTGIE